MRRDLSPRPARRSPRPVRGFAWTAAILLGQAGPARALDCADTITRAAAACVAETGLANARACRAQAEARGCGASGQSGPDLRGACARENRGNVDWVFVDAGAQARFRAFLAGGRAPFDALMAAQGHNPPVQQSFLRCRGWVEAYLEGRGPEDRPDDAPLGPEACRCASVVPTGGGGFGERGREYRVTNACSALAIAIQFVDAANTARTAWTQAGELAPGGGVTVAAPAYDVPSIRAVEVRRGSASRTCVY